MFSFSHLSVRQKLFRLILLASALAFLCVTVAALFFEVSTFRPRAVEELRTEASVLEEVLSASLDFGLKETADKGLKNHCLNSPIVLAALYDTKNLFTAYRRPDSIDLLPSAPAPAGYEFTARRLSLWQPVHNNENVVIGHLYLIKELPPLHARLPQYTIMTGAVLLALAVVGFVLMSGLRRNVLRPLAVLVNTTAEVARHNDYSIRAAVQRDDELGQLAHAFNQMLETVGLRNAALREASTRIENVFNSTTEVAIISTDPQGVVTIFNTGAERMLGYSSRDVVGKLTPIIWHHADEVTARAAELSRQMGRSITSFETFVARARHGEPEARDWTYVRKDGTHLMAHSVVTAVQDAQGSITGFLGVANDITVRKQAEAEIHRLNEELERRVIERTAQLEAANKELEAFSYSVSHDLRAPLRHITGYVNLLNTHAGEALDAEGHRLLDTVASAAQRMASLIDDLLAFSRTSRAPMRLAPISLNQLVEECRQELAPDLKDRNVTWAISTFPEVLGDRALIKQVLLNLLGNAVKYTRKRLEARIEVGFQSGDTEWQFHVRDNGLGFNMKYSDKLFRVFQRLHSDAEIEGTGIGLANVRRVIQRHGGRTWAEGEPNQGAVFFFTLPKHTPALSSPHHMGDGQPGTTNTIA